MQMKKRILKITNGLLKPFGASIVKDNSDFQMASVVRRIADHHFEVKSVIDIGASDGKWSLSAMEVFPNASILAIDPLKERESNLEACKRKHANFDYELCVAGESDGGYASLNVSDDLDGSTVNGTGGAYRQVPVKTIDAIVSKKNLKGPFLIKFDTHGYEVPILKGARETLNSTNIIVMEAYNFQITDNALRFNEMCSYMETLGFRCYDIAGPILRLYDYAFWQIDLFFCKKDSKIFSYCHYK
jgi:FkbM family methyltransferase